MSQVLIVNGVEKKFDVDNMPNTIADLLGQMEISQATVVAELEGTIVHRKDFADTKLFPGQSIELVRFVGGG